MNTVITIANALFEIDRLLCAIIATVLLGGVVIFAVVGSIFLRPKAKGKLTGEERGARITDLVNEYRRNDADQGPGSADRAFAKVKHEHPELFEKP
jgi:hypothetical protein